MLVVDVLEIFTLSRKLRCCLRCLDQSFLCLKRPQVVPVENRKKLYKNTATNEQTNEQNK